MNNSGPKDLKYRENKFSTTKSFKHEDDELSPNNNHHNNYDSEDPPQHHALRNAGRDINYQSLNILGKRARQENGLVELTKKFI